MRVFRSCLGVLLAAGCAGGPFAGVFHSPTPWEEYEGQLRESGLAETAMGRSWLRASETALANPVAARLPLAESGYFPADLPSAVGYQVELTRGRVFEIEVRFESSEPSRLFVDLFELRDGERRRIRSLPTDSAVLRHEVRRTGTYLLRLQPELLRSGRYTISQRTLASLVFPVPSLSIRAIQSGFGAPRDAGEREHHGVDIFAPRGTPVIAVRDGTAHPGTNERGGIVVWLRDGETRRNYYYAHLDRWAFESSRSVVRGDTLGFVGNTGNARTTPPHLHFGIYEAGPVDPFPFLAPDDPLPDPVEFPPGRWREWVRVTAARSQLRSGPHPGAPSLGELERGAVAQVVAAGRNTVRVRLPDGSAGYVAAGAVVSAERALRREQLPAGSVLFESPVPGSPPVAILDTGAVADVLGRHGTFDLVQLPGVRPAWAPGGR